MSAAHALFPGSFDPPTFGHVDLIERANAIFESLTLGVAAHPKKATLFTVEERIEMLEAVTAGLAGVRVVRVEGLLVDACRTAGASVVVRGVRNGTDFDYEVQMAHTNRGLLPTLDTVLLAPAPHCAHVSSTLVRQIASLGGDVESLVPLPIAEALYRRFR